MGPNSFNSLAMGHPNTSHESKVVVKMAGFAMPNQMKFWNREANGPQRAEVNGLGSCILR